MRISLIFILMILTSPLMADEDFERQELINRIQPVGTVTVQPDASTPAPSAAAVSQPVVKKVTGQELFEKYCTVCHQTGVAGAPKFRDATDWGPRLTQKKLDGLVASALKGLNAMPAKGTCSECSEEDIKHAIQYMLPQS
jgi:cytochrome c5